jgi:hypothetical protein
MSRASCRSAFNPSGLILVRIPRAAARAFAAGCARSLDQQGRALADNALNAGHDLALGQMPAAHQPLATRSAYQHAR